jgi:hypothetical protein
MANTFKAETTVSAQQICDQIITALEGGSGYWCSSFKLASSENQPVERPWYADPKLYEGAFVIDVRTNEPSMQDTYKLTPDAVQKGLKFLAGGKHADVIGDMLTENGDANTADLFLQACVFNEIVFG